VPAEGVVAVKTYQVRAKRWEHGWELHVDGVGVTQSHTLASAERQVRDYVSLTLDVADDSFGVEVMPELPRPADQLMRSARKAKEEFERAQREVNAAQRSVVARLKADGLSQADIARVMRVSAQRVSQLADAPSAVAEVMSRSRVAAAARGGRSTHAGRRAKDHA
jgi:hypothetical protein